MPRAPKHYVNNKKLYETYVEYKLQKVENLAAGLPKPPIPKYIAESMMYIAENLIKKGNFSSYPFTQDMIGDGIENCVKYFDSFNTDYKNPFAYLTQIIKNAFILRIKKEKKYLYTKNKIYERSYQTGGLTTQQPGDTTVYTVNVDSLNSDYMTNLVNEVDEAEAKKKEKENER